MQVRGKGKKASKVVGIQIFATTLLFACLFPIPPSDAAGTLQKIDKTDAVWIIGTDVNGYSCWSLSSPQQVPTLQVKDSGRWITEARAKLSKRKVLCPEAKYPWVATYHWFVDELGDKPHAGSLSRDIVAREFIPKYGASGSYASPPFVKQVYRSQSDLMSDYASALNGVNNNLTNDAPGTNPKFAGCMFNGKRLYGKVQVVDFSPDLKVQVVDFSPDLKVQKVDFSATSCGKWQFVDFSPDIKIQFVDFSPDIKIQYVNFSPGLP